MAGPPTLEALLARLRAPDPRVSLADLAREVVPGQTGPQDLIVALAWAARDLDGTVRATALPFRRAARDRIFDGATAAVRYGPLLLLVETPLHPEHGRVAAYLSRHGDGLMGLFVDRPRFLPPAHAGARSPRPHHTPFGRRGWLLPHEWPWGPFVVALEEGRGRPR